MTTRRPAPDDRPSGNWHNWLPAGAHPGEDPPEAQRARLASFWALALRRFRAYAHRIDEQAAHRNGFGENGGP